MIDTGNFYNCLIKNGLDFFCGVPDSLLKSFCAYVSDNTDKNKHIIAANEGNAIAIAAGHYLASSRPAVVYMQNSGLGNCINPLVSLVDEEVYQIPLLMIIGLRGEEGTKDEPQHIKQGKVTDKILESISIDYAVVSYDEKEALGQLEYACNYIKENKKPYALIVRKNTFSEYKLKNLKTNRYELTREEAVIETVRSIEEDSAIISTTGQISRELYEYRDSQKQFHNRDFLTVGSMGHASSIALGIALENPLKKIYCFDGDGAFIMHLGALPVISSMKLKSFRHIIFNNEAHDSVGAQPTSADRIDFKKLAKASGYDRAYSVKSLKELKSALEKMKKIKGTVLLEIKVKCGSRANLGRPKEKPVENKEAFMTHLKENAVFKGSASLNGLKDIVETHKAKSVLIFCGKKSYNKIKNAVEKNLKNVKIQRYNDFSSNPKSDEVDRALDTLKDFDLILAVGGGSVLDFSKLFRFCYDNKIKTKEALNLNICAKKTTPLIAVPTTAGTGAEATKFSVVYVDNKKYSFEHDYILPDYVILEGSFVKDNPKYLKACCGADALCQAIESYWSVNSTPLSKYYAKCAMQLCSSNLEKYVHSNNPKYAKNMQLAAFYSGRAINISKTTAAHAISYKITTDYNLAHGHAVSLSIAKLMKINYLAQNVIDNRGRDYVHGNIEEIKDILNIDDIEEYFLSLFENIGLEQNISKLGIDNIEEIALATDIKRLSNNPIQLSTEDLTNLFYKI